MRHVDIGDVVRYRPAPYPVATCTGRVTAMRAPSDAPPSDGATTVTIWRQSGPGAGTSDTIPLHQVDRVVRPICSWEQREGRIRAQALRMAAWRLRHAPNVPARVTATVAADLLDAWAIGEDHLTRLEEATLYATEPAA